jgi:hypothetical protein
VLREHARSGKRDGEFCAERGVGVHALRAWRYRLAREDAQRTRPARTSTERTKRSVDFVPVRVRVVGERVEAANDGALARDGGPRAGVEVVLSRDRIIRVHPGFDEETLLRVVALFERR